MSLPQDVNDRNYRKHRETSKGVAVAVIDDSLPVDGNNPSFLISKNASGEVVYVDTTISGTTYRQTLTRSDMTITQTLAISANVEL